MVSVITLPTPNTHFNIGIGPEQTPIVDLSQTYTLQTQPRGILVFYELNMRLSNVKLKEKNVIHVYLGSTSWPPLCFFRGLTLLLWKRSNKVRTRNVLPSSWTTDGSSPLVGTIQLKTLFMWWYGKGSYGSSFVLMSSLIPPKLRHRSPVSGCGPQGRRTS